jgi:hypothetical protein
MVCSIYPTCANQKFAYLRIRKWTALHTKKENYIFLIYKEIQKGALAKSYMRKGLLIYEEMRKYLVIFEEAVSLALQPRPSEFPFI